MLHYRWENREKQRYYRVILAKDLFGEWIITKIWGGLNKAGGGAKHVPCQTFELGIKLIEKISKTRDQRGYTRISTLPQSLFE